MTHKRLPTREDELRRPFTTSAFYKRDPEKRCETLLSITVRSKFNGQAISIARQDIDDLGHAVEAIATHSGRPLKGAIYLDGRDSSQSLRNQFLNGVFKVTNGTGETIAEVPVRSTERLNFIGHVVELANQAPNLA